MSPLSHDPKEFETNVGMTHDIMESWGVEMEIPFSNINILDI